MRYTPEQARDALSRYQGSQTLGFVRRYLEAIRDGELPRYYCQQLAGLKLGSDDLPPHRLVGPWHPDYPAMKCRGNTIFSISLALQEVLENELIRDNDVKQTITDFRQRKWNALREDSPKKGTFWTTSEEIQSMNTMLDTVIQYLEMTYGVHVDWVSAQKEIDAIRADTHKKYRNIDF